MENKKKAEKRSPHPQHTYSGYPISDDMLKINDDLDALFDQVFEEELAKIRANARQPDDEADQ